MSKLDELLKQENLEKGISEIISYIQKGPESVNTLMNPRLTGCSEKEKSITLEFPVLEWQLNPYDKMHGGLIATAFDEAFGVFAFYLSGKKPVVSVNLTFNYLKPVPMNDAIRITVKATSLGRKLLTMSGECYLKSSGDLTNTAIGTFAIL